MNHSPSGAKQASKRAQRKGEREKEKVLTEVDSEFMMNVASCDRHKITQNFSNQNFHLNLNKVPRSFLRRKMPSRRP